MLQFSAKYINNNYYCLFNVLVITIILIIDDIYKNNIFGQIMQPDKQEQQKLGIILNFLQIKKKCTLLLNSLDAASQNIMMLKNSIFN